MLSFLEGISKRLTDRILVDAVLPGLVWIAALRFALTIGHVHPADLSAVSRRVQELWTGLGTRGTGSGVVLVIVLAVAAYVVAQVTAGLSLVVRRCWLDEGRLRFLAPLRRHRRERWTSERNAAEAARDAGDLAAADVHDAARNAIAWAEPQCASWMGDRMAALESRVRAEHGLDLVSAWPAIWFLVAENIREEISAADEGFRKAVSVSAWGLLFAPLGLWCWPIGLVGGGRLCRRPVPGQGPSGHAGQERRRRCRSVHGAARRGDGRESRRGESTARAGDHCPHPQRRVRRGLGMGLRGRIGEVVGRRLEAYLIAKLPWAPQYAAFLDRAVQVWRTYDVRLAESILEQGGQLLPAIPDGTAQYATLRSMLGMALLVGHETTPDSGALNEAITLLDEAYDMTNRYRRSPAMAEERYLVHYVLAECLIARFLMRLEVKDFFAAQALTMPRTRSSVEANCAVPRWPSTSTLPS